MTRRKKPGKGGDERLRPMMVPSKYPPYWYWRKVSGKRKGNMVHFSVICDYAIVKIMNILDEEGSTYFLKQVEQIARERGIIDESGEMIKVISPPREGNEEAQA